jgi:hypothetical protein
MYFNMAADESFPYHEQYSNQSINSYIYSDNMEARGSVVGSGTTLQTGSRGIESR